jgi:hypothetical protein
MNPIAEMNSFAANRVEGSSLRMSHGTTSIPLLGII